MSIKGLDFAPPLPAPALSQAAMIDWGFLKTAPGSYFALRLDSRSYCDAQYNVLTSSAESVGSTAPKKERKKVKNASASVHGLIGNVTDLTVVDVSPKVRPPHLRHGPNNRGVHPAKTRKVSYLFAKENVGTHPSRKENPSSGYGGAKSGELAYIWNVRSLSRCPNEFSARLTELMAEFAPP